MVHWNNPNMEIVYTTDRPTNPGSIARRGGGGAGAGGIVIPQCLDIR